MKEILMNIAITAILCGLFKLLLPENGMKKQINLLIACFFLSSIVYFVTNGNVTFISDAKSILDQGGYVDFTSQYTIQTQNEIANELARQIRAYLQEKDVRLKEIRINVHISDTNSISINEILLVLYQADENDPEQVRSFVQEKVGDQILVTIRQE
jgi:hypothetical protein